MQQAHVEIRLLSDSDPFQSIILKYGILSWLMKENLTVVNGNYVGSWAVQLNSFLRAFPKSPRTTKIGLTNVLVHAYSVFEKGMMLKDNIVVSIFKLLLSLLSSRTVNKHDSWRNLFYTIKSSLLNTTDNSLIWNTVHKYLHIVY